MLLTYYNMQQTGEAVDASDLHQGPLITCLLSAYMAYQC